jgi:hypothetical protein
VSGRIAGVSLEERPSVSAQIFQHMGDRAGGRPRRLYFHEVHQDGRFAFSYLPAGEAAFWLARGVKGQASPPPFLGRINVTGDMEGVLLRISVAASVVGKIVWADQPPESPIELTISTKYYDGSIERIRLEPPNFEFERTGLPPIDYRLGTDQGFYIQEVLSGNEVLAAGEFGLEPGEQRHLTIVAGTRFATVNSRVFLPNGRRPKNERSPARHFDVLLDRAGVPLVQQTDQFGVARFDRVPAGDYMICAFPEKPRLQRRSNTNCKKAGESARAVRIESGSTVEIACTSSL